MTAAVIALCGLAAALTGGLIAAGAWLRNEIEQGKRLRDRLDSEQDLTHQYRSERDLALGKLRITADELEMERTLRTSAELQRNEAQAKARQTLAKYARHLPDDEIRVLVHEMFTVPLSMRPGSELERP
jgi:hypothetical protein